MPVSRLAYGCMRISGTWNPSELTAAHIERGRAALLSAYESGYTLFDHADIYGRGTCELIHGDILRDTPSLRDQTLIVSKCGVRLEEPYRYELTAAHIERSCEESLLRLGVDQIFLYLLHRPDWLWAPDEVSEALERLRRAGKVEHVGVSNFSPARVRTLRVPLAAHQVEISLGQWSALEDGTLDQCQEMGMRPMAWGPLGGGAVLSSVPLQEMAEEYGVSPAQLAIAWILMHPSGIIPILGSTDPVEIAAMTEALQIDLSREDWYRLLVAARGERLP